jgi:hypothetical protein
VPEFVPGKALENLAASTDLYVGGRSAIFQILAQSQFWKMADNQWPLVCTSCGRERKERGGMSHLLMKVKDVKEVRGVSCILHSSSVR